MTDLFPTITDFTNGIRTELSERYPCKTFSCGYETGEDGTPLYRLYVNGLPTPFSYFPTLSHELMELHEVDIRELIDMWVDSICEVNDLLVSESTPDSFHCLIR